MSRKTAIPWLLLCAIVFGVAAWFVFGGSCRQPDPVINIQPDTIPDEVIVKERPKPPKSIPQKITTQRVKPKKAVSRGTPDTLHIRHFAAVAVLTDSIRRLNDSLQKLGEPPIPLPPSILPPAWGQYREDGRFSLWMSRSDGSVMRTTARLKPNWSFVAGIDPASRREVQFYQDRAWLRTLRQIKKCAPVTGVMTGVGALFSREDRLLAAAIAGGTTLIGCLVG